MHAIQLKLPDDGSVKVRLNRSSYFTLPANDPIALEVLSGCAWITQEGDRDDHFLGKGERFNLPGRGEAIVQAMSESEIAVIPRAPHVTLPATPGVLALFSEYVSDLFSPEGPAWLTSQERPDDATRCWGNAIARQNATRLGLERTF